MYYSFKYLRYSLALLEYLDAGSVIKLYCNPDNLLQYHFTLLTIIEWQYFQKYYICEEMFHVLR